ncbi:MAG: hypothetical protein CM15mV3_1540 [Caudoviricetes sp.]|nr:MAG: hypothetical protein CM15mV3_1540 [Caudoviricetes sp.]
MVLQLLMSNMMEQKDTGRPLQRDAQGPYISNGGVFNLNIGSKVSDITLT